MKKAVVAFLILGGAVGIGYTQGYLDNLFGGRDAAEGKTPNLVATIPFDPEGFYEAGDYEGAASLLNARTAAGGTLEEKNLVLLARCYRGMGDSGAEKDTWQKILREFSGHPVCGEALWNLASIAKRENRSEEALSYCREALEKYPASEGGTRAAMDLGEYYIEKGDRDNARGAFSAALASARPMQREKLKKILTELNRELLFSGIPSNELEIYAVRPGDSLSRIARKYRTTVGLIKKVNRLDSNIIHPGQELKILKGEVGLEISKSTFTLALYINGVWIKEYLVGTGKDDKTPEGEFEIANRIVNPPWFWKGEVIPAGDPRNILGIRWMGFKNKPGLTGFGIHGTTEPGSVPGAVSRGCIRMKNEDIEDLFEMVPLGTKVMIRK